MVPFELSLIVALPSQRASVSLREVSWTFSTDWILTGWPWDIRFASLRIAAQSIPETFGVQAERNGAAAKARKAVPIVRCETRMLAPFCEPARKWACDKASPMRH